MTRVQRIDRRRIRFDDIQTDARGFAQLWGPLITGGQVLEYGPADGFADPHFELVPAETVFNEASLATLRAAPITLNHPQTQVTADNSNRLSVGHIIGERRVGDDLEAHHQIEDSHVLDGIRSGETVELSLGYSVRVEDTPGVTDSGQHYDAIQFDRVINHVAIVPMARAGHDKRLSIDAWIPPGADLLVQRIGETIMVEYKMEDGKTVEVDSGLLADIAAKLKKAAGSQGDGEDDEDDEDGKGKDASNDPDEDEDGKGKDASGTSPQSSSADSAPPFDFEKLIAGVTEKITGPVTRSVLAATDQRHKDSIAAGERRASIIAMANDALSASYNPAGKTDDEVMLDAIVGRDADLKTQAGSLKGDGLHGFFLATMSQKRDTGLPGDSVRGDSGAGPTMADVIEAQAKRRDAAGACGLVGTAALKHESVLSIVPGGK